MTSVAKAPRLWPSCLLQAQREPAVPAQGGLLQRAEQRWLPRGRQRDRMAAALVPGPTPTHSSQRQQLGEGQVDRWTGCRKQLLLLQQSHQELVALGSPPQPGLLPQLPVQCSTAPGDYPEEPCQSVRGERAEELVLTWLGCRQTQLMGAFTWKIR